MRASLGGLGSLALLILCNVGPSELSRVKPGECPFQYMACDYPPPYMHTCNEDSGCPGSQKCCLNFCHRECRDAMPAKGKPGTCPPHYRHMFPDKADTCRTDKDCKGELKCCDWQGGFTCVAPVRAKTFGCPKKDAACKTSSYEMCEDETDCWGFNRCCDSYCTLPCEDPVIGQRVEHPPSQGGEGSPSQAQQDSDPTDSDATQRTVDDPNQPGSSGSQTPAAATSVPNTQTIPTTSQQTGQSPAHDPQESLSEIEEHPLSDTHEMADNLHPASTRGPGNQMCPQAQAVLVWVGVVGVVQGGGEILASQLQGLVCLNLLTSWRHTGGTPGR